MMHRKGLWLLIAAMVVVAAGTAQADTIKVTFGQYYNGPGGEFTFSNYTPVPISPQALNVRTAPGSFQSFCLEKNEYIDNGATYDYLLSGFSQLGGLGGGNPDPLSAATAYLFTQFWNGTLAGYDFTDTGVGRKVSAKELQKAIWALEDEGAAPTGGQAKTWYDAALASGWTNIGNVRVMNLYTVGYAGSTLKSYNHQSQLVVVPLPVASLAGLALLGAMGLAGAVRRRRR
jgi:hypothetical protein